MGRISIIDGRRKRKEPGLVCKIDLEKAYDKVDWGFLKWVLMKKGFGKKVD